jgi:hypothetical protein
VTSGDWLYQSSRIVAIGHSTETISEMARRPCLLAEKTFEVVVVDCNVNAVYEFRSTFSGTEIQCYK